MGILESVGAILRDGVRYLGFLLSFVVPRRSDRWVFGASNGHRFDGNSKYLFLYLHELASDDHEHVRPIWISRDGGVIQELSEAGFEAYPASSLPGLYHTYRAKYVFVTHTLRDVCVPGTGGATVVNLWHAVPTKRVAWDTEVAVESLGALGWAQKRLMYWTYDYVTTTAESLVDIFAGAFRTEEEVVVVTGYPRNDALFEAFPGEMTGEHMHVLDEIRERVGGSSLVGYFPTWRTTAPGLDRKRFDPAAIETSLEAAGAYLVVKFHPDAASDIDISSRSRIIELPPTVDVYPLLRDIDVLVTDYSSIYADFLLVDRPIIFYPYDLDSYVAEERGFYFPYEEYAPGPIARDLETFLERLDETLRGTDGYAEDRDRVRDHFFDHVDGASSERVVQFVERSP